MSMESKMAHDDKIEALAQEYLRQGFAVTKEPSAELIPFDLGGYRPDLIAQKGNKNLVIEVKSTASRISIGKLQSIAQEIARHEGWRFLLVTLDDIDSGEVSNLSEEFPAWSQLEQKLLQARALIAAGAIEPAMLYMWSIFEAALRRRAISQNIPVERLPATMLIKHMYSQGEVSVNDVDTFLDFMKIRNRIAHGANESIDVEKLTHIFQAINRLLVEWQSQEPN